jgi:hypothetical protein
MIDHDTAAVADVSDKSGAHRLGPVLPVIIQNNDVIVFENRMPLFPECHIGPLHGRLLLLPCGQRRVIGGFLFRRNIGLRFPRFGRGRRGRRGDVHRETTAFLENPFEHRRGRFPRVVVLAVKDEALQFFPRRQLREGGKEENGGDEQVMYFHFYRSLV